MTTAFVCSNSRANNGKLMEVVDEIKTEGKNKQYDFTIGVSGGVDSNFQH